MVKIQKEPFNINDLFFELKLNNSKIGGITSFIGYVRDFASNKKNLLNHLEIEQYEGMTEKTIKRIELLAKKKWKLENIIIIHRYGILKLDEQIVFVGVASSHRDDAFKACEFIIDYLKVDAPFWKKQVSNNHSFWVQQKESDLAKVK